MRTTSIAAGLAAAALTVGGTFALTSAVDGNAASGTPQAFASAAGKNASAASPPGSRFGDMPGVAEAARRAGVGEGALSEALFDLHGQWPAGDWSEEARTVERRLADALGVSAGAVRSALSKVHDDPSMWRSGWDERTFERDLAQALGVPAAKVRAAFRAEHDRLEEELAGRLAKRLGIGEDRARAALDALAESHDDWSAGGWGHGPGGP